MIFNSPHGPVTIPVMVLTDFVLQQADERGDKPALIDGLSGRTIRYGQLNQTIRLLAAGFASHGLSKGDVLAIFSPNLPEYALAFHALCTLGAITTMVPPLFTKEEIQTQLKNSGASYLLTVPSLVERAREIVQETNIRKIFVVGEAERTTSFSSLLNHGNDFPIANIDPCKDLSVLPYSSGTTGFPKGVMLTHYNLVSMLCQMGAQEAVLTSDTLICVVPMYHMYGLHIVVNLALYQGATVIMLPRYELSEFLSTLERYKVTVAPLVPPLVLALARAPEVEGYDLSHLRLIHCGAAPLPDDVAQACTHRLGCQIRYGYGLTEVSPLSHASPPELKEDRPGSVGFPLANTECKIIDYVSGTELGPNQEGEICVRGPQVMKGYLKNHQATTEMVDKEGWLRTGDIGYADVAGRLFVIDRVKELIKYKGRQVAPAELEALLMSHPAIADACVIPSPDEEAGEIPKAFVVLKSKATAQELMDFVAARVAPHKRIRKVEFASEIPKSPAGKILRRVLVQQERASLQPKL